MPRRDGTGPMGQGAMTGKGFGLCTGANALRCVAGIGAGLGLGFGARRGFRKIQELGYAGADSQKELLKQQKDLLENRLELVKNQLDSLKDVK